MSDPAIPDEVAGWLTDVPVAEVASRLQPVSLLSGRSARFWARAAFGTTLASVGSLVLVVLGSGIADETARHWIVALGSAVAILLQAATLLSYARMSGRSRTERRAGYTTLHNRHLEYPELDDRTGAVLRPARVSDAAHSSDA